MNFIFLGTLLIDIVCLGFKEAYSRYPRVATESLSQAIFLIFMYIFISNNGISYTDDEEKKKDIEKFS